MRYILVFIALLLGSLDTPASAAQLSVTIKGIASGVDTFNYFGAGVNMSDQSYYANYTYNNFDIVKTEDGSYIVPAGSQSSSGLDAPSPSSELRINGRTIGLTASTVAGATTFNENGVGVFSSRIALVSSSPPLFSSNFDIITSSPLESFQNFYGSGDSVSGSGELYSLIYNGPNVEYEQEFWLKFSVSEFSMSLINDVVSEVPEPNSWALMIIGFGALGGRLRKRNKSKPISVDLC